MTPTSVGMRCPECSRERTKVRTLRRATGRPIATETLIAVNAVAFLAELATGITLGGGGGGWVFDHGALFGPAMTAGHHEYWRIVTAGFLHASLLHIAFNMFFLYFIGRTLEPAIGTLNFVVIYLTSLIVGSFGALLFQPDVPTLGASTACFGIFGALIVVAYDRKIPIWQSGLGPTLLINLVFTLTVGNISLGGHLGGLIAGFICGWLVVSVGERRGQPALAIAGCAAVAALGFLGAIAVAGGHGLTPTGLTL
jgi:membrane associated rhomboid family serine protease